MGELFARGRRAALDNVVNDRLGRTGQLRAEIGVASRRERTHRTAHVDSEFMGASPNV
jgi:hypothetical protein